MNIGTSVFDAFKMIPLVKSVSLLKPPDVKKASARSPSETLEKCDANRLIARDGLRNLDIVKKLHLPKVGCIASRTTTKHQH